MSNHKLKRRCRRNSGREFLLSLTLGLFLLPWNLQAAEDGDGVYEEGDSEAELAKATQNPVADLISVPFQNNFNFGIGENDATQWVLNLQPVVPFNLNENWNLITRTIAPIIYQDSPAPGVESVFGLGDINPSFFFSPKNSGELIWGAGPAITLPTGTDLLLTAGQYAAGPSAVGLTIQGPWVAGFWRIISGILRVGEIETITGL